MSLDGFRIMAKLKKAEQLYIVRSLAQFMTPTEVVKDIKAKFDIDVSPQQVEAYDDGVGVWTIGYGTTIYPNGVAVKKDESCTLEQAKSFFQHDLRRFQTAVNGAVTVPLSQNQFDALVSLAYNIGTNAFKTSTLVNYLNALDYKAAADEFLKWKRGGGKVMKGLVRRRETERALFLKK